MTGARPVLGIDPGVSGGIAALYPDGRIEAYDIPVVDGSVDVDALVRRIREHAPRLAVIEKAQAMPRQGVSSTFKYGTAFGALCAVTAICEIPTHLVSPRKWKTHFGRDSDKEKSRALAIRLWPATGLFERKKDHGRSEAALLARYGAEVIEHRHPQLRTSVPGAPMLDQTSAPEPQPERN
jgi:crossover junction endodeoxyribonuclease RuvC